MYLKNLFHYRKKRYELSQSILRFGHFGDFEIAPVDFLPEGIDLPLDDSHRVLLRLDGRRRCHSSRDAHGIDDGSSHVANVYWHHGIGRCLGQLQRLLLQRRLVGTARFLDVNLRRVYTTRLKKWKIYFKKIDLVLEL